jgi:hypothetical protein
MSIVIVPEISTQHSGLMFKSQNASFLGVLTFEEDTNRHQLLCDVVLHPRRKETSPVLLAEA